MRGAGGKKALPYRYSCDLFYPIIGILSRARKHSSHIPCLAARKSISLQFLLFVTFRASLVTTLLLIS
jgi:hypothetical protein